jgi:hypothetical protein
MKRSLIFTIVLFCSFSGMFANDELTQTIRGSITDAITGSPLIGAYVIVLNSEPKIGVAADVNGLFELKKVPVGRQSLEISYLGYETKTITSLLVVSGKELMLDIKLEEKTTGISEIVVRAASKKATAQNDMAMISARTFSVEETERFAGSLGDPARMVANYAGVMTQNDSRNDIIIRGNSPTGVLWRLEGIEIQNPNHFGAQGTTGGPVSMINNNLLANSDFLTGAFPAEFGNATAGAFDLNLRSGNSNSAEFTGQVGFNGFEVGAEGPLMKLKNGLKATYLANFRYSTLELLDKIGFNVGTGSAVPQYNDFTFMLDVPSTKVGRLKFFGLHGTSFIGLGRDLNDTTENQYNSRGMATDFEAKLGVIGASHLLNLRGNIRIKSTLSWQNSHALAVLDSVNNKTFVPYLRGDQGEKKLSFTTQLRKKISASDNINIGLIIDSYNISYIDSIYDKDYDRFMTTTDIKGQMNMYRTYMQWQHKAGQKITSYTGLLFQYSGLNNELAVEPRLGLRFDATQKSFVNLGFGLHSQMQPKVAYFHQEYNPVSGKYNRTNEDLKFSHSMHLVAGYQYQLSDNFRIKLESYYQHLYKVPVKESFTEFSLINAGDQFGIPREDSLLNKGKGRNYGVEITIEKFLDKGWYFLFTSSLFDSKYTGYDNIWRNTAFNGNYVFNLLGGYEHRLGKNSMLTFDTKTVWAGGKRYIPVNVAESIAQNKEVLDWSRAYNEKYNDYFRTDLRFGLKINKKRFSHEWAIDLQNITAYKSTFYQAWDVKNKEVYTVYQQGFIPMFLYRIQF